MGESPWGGRGDRRDGKKPCHLSPPTDSERVRESERMKLEAVKTPDGRRSGPLREDGGAPCPLSDEEVVARVRGGETALYEVLMRRYNQRVYRVARSILRNDAEAEDV